MSGSYDDRDGKIWMNGKLIEWRDANVHILTHAMHYASSVFEGERAYNGKIFKSVLHSQRLLKSAKMVDFEIPYSVDEIEKAKYDALRANKLEDAYVRAVAWRGAGEDMGVASLRNPVNLAVATWSWGNYYGDAKMKGAKLDVAKWQRPDPKTAPFEAKAAGLYMIATMSKHTAEANGCSDAMMMDYRGYVAEATGANIFFKDKNGDLHTPIPDSFLDGITRRTVIDIAKSKNIKVNERKILPDELGNFVGCFLTGTAAEVTPVSQIQDFNFKVCNTIIDLSESYQSLVRKKVAA